MAGNGGSKISTTIIAAIFGLMGTLLGAYTQGCFNLQLEREKFHANSKLDREKFETNLILKSIETGDPGRAAQNLDFLVKAGLISDPGGKISALVKDPAMIPVLPCSTIDVPGKGDGPRAKH